MLWYIIVFLDFYFSKYSQIGWAKILVSCTIFLCCLFICFFLMHNFKTNNNFSPKICYENAINVKNKIIKYQTKTYHSWK